MRKNVGCQFVIMTFLFMLCGWGVTVVAGLFELTLKKAPWLYAFYLLGGWSPTIASYIVLKRTEKVTGLKDWLKQIFTVKQPVKYYLLVAVLLLCSFVPLCLISGYTRTEPLYSLLTMLPMVFVGGGLEEVGWRFILQPELEKKVSFGIASSITGVIWAVWHLPLFFIEGVAQAKMQFFVFAIMTIGLAFALGAIYSLTKSVWLCMLFHTFANAIQGVFVVNQSYTGAISSTIIVIVVASLLQWTGKKSVGK